MGVVGVGVRSTPPAGEVSGRSGEGDEGRDDDDGDDEVPVVKAWFWDWDCEAAVWRLEVNGLWLN